jgi:hypothetical protein
MKKRSWEDKNEKVICIFYSTSTQRWTNVHLVLRKATRPTTLTVKDTIPQWWKKYTIVILE